ncbi:protein translocase subunit SecD, partial [candidate division WWE3 bacterium]|nr:protein translocase subunit SecD [candidate division WWE3 bacterium]
MRNEKVILGVIVGLTIVSLLVVLPRTPIKIRSGKFANINIDTSVGGYVLNLFGGRVFLDLREVKKGLDLQGGVRVVLKADMSKISDGEKDAALESAKQIISRRVDLLGVSEPLIQTSKVGGDYRLIVELPGVTDVTTALNTIGKTAQLVFKQIKKDTEYDRARYSEYLYNPDAWEETGVTGADLKGADVVFDQSGSSLNAGPQIRLRFSEEGRAKFSDTAKNNVNKPIGLFFNDSPIPISAPNVDPDLAQGLTSDPVISGSFSVEEANSLSISIRAGALPVPVDVLEQKTIGATLGQESIRRSIIAGAVGVLLIFLFMTFNYGRLGVLASFALIIYGLLTISVFKVVPVVITLPGIAGFVLSLGMAVDANILTFERIIEEIRWGKPFNLALKLGFERAWPSIRDSNFSTLITSAILYQFGT